MRKAARQTTKPVSTKTELRDVSKIKRETGRELMQAVLAKPRNTEKADTRTDERITGIVIGTLSEPTEHGQVMVQYPGIPMGKPLAAISTEDLSQQKSGQEVALGFVNGDPALPIILGLIQKPGGQNQSSAEEAPEGQSVNVKIDGEKLTLSAEREIVLQCGKSSITLTRAGKVILKGAYLSTHSTGVNRIKGGSVQIN